MTASNRLSIASTAWASSKGKPMKLHEPFRINSRLLPSITIGDGELSLDEVGTTHEGRIVFRWYVDIPSGEFSEADLKSGCGGIGSDTQKMFAALCSFLSAAGESYRWWMSEGMNEDNKPEHMSLFPLPVVEWAYQHNDELGSMAALLEEETFIEE